MLMSSYELIVAKILEAAAIRYETEKTFDDCKFNGHHFRFDFYIPKLKMLIEVDGEPHFKHIFGKYKSDFTHYQENDRRKNSYCLAREIPLFRIPYWDIHKISCFEDILQDKYRVTTKWHNDIIAP